MYNISSVAVWFVNVYYQFRISAVVLKTTIDNFNWTIIGGF